MYRSDVLLERISDIWASKELSEEDIASSEATERFRDLCTSLCTVIIQHKDFLTGDSPGKLKVAVNAVLRSASSERESKKGQLDRAMISLDRALDPASTAQARMDVLERLVAAVQALRLLSMSPKSIETTERTEDLHEKSDDQGSVLPDVVEVSQQLCEIASLLEVETHGGCAKPLLSAANERLPQILQALPESFFSPLLPQGSLSPDQMTAIMEVESDLRQEYSIRRRMLIERAKVLMQSFMRADRLKEENLAQEAKSLVDKYATTLRAEPAVSLSDIFTARQADLVALSSKSISGNKFVASVKQLNIGAVPNRGGIPSDRLNGQGQPRATAPGREFHKKCRLK